MRNKNFTKKKKQKNKRNLKKNKRNLKKSKRNLTNKIGGNGMPRFGELGANNIKHILTGNIFGDIFTNDIFTGDILNGNTFSRIIEKSNTATYNISISQDMYNKISKFKRKFIYLIPTLREEETPYIKERLEKFLDTKLMKKNIRNAFERVTKEKNQGKIHDYTNCLFGNETYFLLYLCIGKSAGVIAGIIRENGKILLDITSSIIPTAVLDLIPQFKYAKYFIDIIIYTIIKGII